MTKLSRDTFQSNQQNPPSCNSKSFCRKKVYLTVTRQLITQTRMIYDHLQDQDYTINQNKGYTIKQQIKITESFTKYIYQFRYF